MTIIEHIPGCVLVFLKLIENFYEEAVMDDEINVDNIVKCSFIILNFPQNDIIKLVRSFESMILI